MPGNDLTNFDCKTHSSETERDVNLLKFSHLGPLWAWLCNGPGFSKSDSELSLNALSLWSMTGFLKILSVN